MATEPSERRRRMHARRRITDLATHSDAYITVQAFAEHLSVNQRTVMKWIKCGVLTGYRFDTEWWIRTADAIAFVERNRYLEVERGTRPEQEPKRVEERDGDGCHEARLSEDVRDFKQRNVYVLPVTTAGPTSQSV